MTTAKKTGSCNLKNITRLSTPVLVFTFVALTGCVDAARSTQELHSTKEREMTVGTVQREIRKGMSPAEVAEQLGSPNIVQKDAEGKEVWIYDKIATEASYSNSSGSATALASAGGAPGNSLILGGLLGNYAKSAGAYASSQKTLTVVIKFNAASRVDSFTYHSSRF